MAESTEKELCGIVMPISKCDGLPADHWKEVLNIIKSVADKDGFDARLVSDTMESNLIHKEILHNIYKDHLIICDVSGRNPNVFFELGIRMATQNPTIIIKDDITDYPFDIAPNRYVNYPRDLRHPGIEIFKQKLSESIGATRNQEKKNSFIGALGAIHVPDVSISEIPASDVIIRKLDQIDRKMSSLHPSGAVLRHRSPSDKRKVVIRSVGENSARIDFTGYSDAQLDIGIIEILREFPENNVEIEYIEGTGSSQSVHLTTKGNITLPVDFIAESLVSAVDGIIPV